VDYLGHGNDALGFALTATFYAGLSLPVFWILFLTVREPEISYQNGKHESVQVNLRALLKNKPFMVMAIATVLATLGSVVASKTLVYYVKYVVGDETAVGTAFAINSLVILAAAPFWAAVTVRTSKRSVWRAGALISLSSSVLLFLNNTETVSMVVAIVGLSAFGAAAAHLTFWSALPDTVEFGELKSGFRDESLVFGVMGFVQKASYGIAAALAGFLLDQIGYQANSVQSEDTLQALKMVMTLVPAGFIFAAFLVIGQYRLDKTTHGRILSLLRKRTVRKGG
jgi:GPH family glycoside/pentoside/hexuronide:cation symporter